MVGRGDDLQIANWGTNCGRGCRMHDAGCMGAATEDVAGDGERRGGSANLREWDANELPEKMVCGHVNRINPEYQLDAYNF